VAGKKIGFLLLFFVLFGLTNIIGIAMQYEMSKLVCGAEDAPLDGNPLSYVYDNGGATVFFSNRQPEEAVGGHDYRVYLDTSVFQ